MAVTYRYWRWGVTKIRDLTAGMMQVAEFQLMSGGARVGGTPTISIYLTQGVNEGSPGGEDVNGAYDNNVGTKFLSFNEFAGIHLDFGTPTLADGYRIATANDAPERDPISWVIEGSTDNTTWTSLNTQTDYPVTLDRQTYLPTFPLGETGPPPASGRTAQFLQFFS